MSAFRSSKPLPISDVEECTPLPTIGNNQPAGIVKPSAAVLRMQTIEEEDSSNIELDSSSSCSDSSLTSGVHSQEPKKEVPREVLEYVEKIREAIEAQSERTSRQRFVELKLEVQTEKKQSSTAGRKREGSLSVLTEKAKNGMIKLTASRQKVSTFIFVKAKAKAGVASKALSIP